MVAAVTAVSFRIPQTQRSGSYGARSMFGESLGDSWAVQGCQPHRRHTAGRSRLRPPDGARKKSR